MIATRRRAAAATVALLALVAAAACTQTATPAGPATSQAPATTTAVTVDRDEDEATGRQALLTTKDLPGNGWTRDPKTATTTSNSTFSCPELQNDDEFRTLDKKGVTVTTGTIDRTDPLTQVQEDVILFPTEEDASRVAELFAQVNLKSCLRRSILHEGTKNTLQPQVSTRTWKLPDGIGDDQLGIEVDVTADFGAGDQDIRTGFAVIRVGRAFATVGITQLDPLGSEATGIVRKAAAKLRDTTDQ